MGYSTVSIYRTEDVLDSLRSRDDFRLLLMDLEFPSDPLRRTRMATADGLSRWGERGASAPCPVSFKTGG